MATLNEVQMDHIVDVYRQYSGNKSEIARVLGINRRTLYRWIEKPDLKTRIAEVESELAQAAAVAAGVG